MKRFLSLLLLALININCAQEFIQSSSDVNASLNTGGSLSISSIEFVNANPFEITEGQVGALWMRFTTLDGTSFQMTAEQFQSRYGNLIWYSNDDDVAVVTDNGEVLAGVPGTTTLLVTYQNVSQVMRVQVLEDEIQTVQFQNESLILDNESGQLLFDVTYQTSGVRTGLSLTDFQSELDCSPAFTLSNETVAFVNLAGQIYPLTNGMVHVDFSCGDWTDSITITVQNLTDDVEYGDPATITDTLLSLSINSPSSVDGEMGSSTLVSARLEFDTAGVIDDVTSLFVLESELFEVEWSSSNEAVATVEDGRVSFVGYGVTDITVSFLGLSDTIQMSAKKVTDRLNNSADAFLDASDTFTITAGSDASASSDIVAVYSTPTINPDVYSMGDGGELVIELDEFVIVDGMGDDFTIFENPFEGWYECAEISVSEDGRTYHSFTCDQYDATEVFAGCSGVGIVNAGLSYSSYLNPSLSGGDQFDLGDLQVETAKYIKITDLGLCATDLSSTYTGPTNGFDLDAIAILNGIYE